MELVVAFLLGAGTLTTALVFLSKSFVTQLLKKDIEKFKVDLQTLHKIEVEQKMLSYKEESIILKESWGLVIKLMDSCENYEGDSKDLESSLKKLEDFIVKNEIFLENEIACVLNELVIIADPDSFTKEKIDDITRLKEDVLNKSKNRILCS